MHKNEQGIHFCADCSHHCNFCCIGLLPRCGEGAGRCLKLAWKYHLHRPCCNPRSLGSHNVFRSEFYWCWSKFRHLTSAIFLQVNLEYNFHLSTGLECLRVLWRIRKVGRNSQQGRRRKFTTRSEEVPTVSNQLWCRYSPAQGHVHDLPGYWALSIVYRQEAMILPCVFSKTLTYLIYHVSSSLHMYIHIKCEYWN